jgi:hypothetical protein
MTNQTTDESNVRQVLGQLVAHAEGVFSQPIVGLPCIRATRLARPTGDRWFADSLLEGPRFEPLVPLFVVTFSAPPLIMSPSPLPLHRKTFDKGRPRFGGNSDRAVPHAGGTEGHFVARISSWAKSALHIDIYLRRTYSGRPSFSIRLSDATAMATSVVCRPSVRERSVSPITRL